MKFDRAITASLLLALIIMISAACSRVDNNEQAPPPRQLQCNSADQLELFERRIAPLLDDSRPASCNRCHLQGIDLSIFVHFDACRSMACMIEDELVSLESPADSPLLERILEGHTYVDTPPDISPPIQEEHDAILEWIEYSARCHESACGDYSDPCLRGEEEPTPTLDCDMGDCGEADMGELDQDMPADDPDMRREVFNPVAPEGFERYGCNEDDIAGAFRDRPWRWNGRCHHCHAKSKATLQPLDPEPWMADRRDAQGAKETVAYLRASDLIDLEVPSESKLILKPLKPAFGGVPHGGGSKIHGLDDEMYIDLLGWIELVSACSAQQ